jgi:Domain of unknown function (DUF4288)
MQWFSTRIRLACIVEQKGLRRFMDSIYVFRSIDFDDAFQRAIEIGRSQEKSYSNDADELVEWRLKEIISLDLIRPQSVDGAEVYSEPVEPAASDFLIDYAFHPEDSNPTQTL